MKSFADENRAWIAEDLQQSSAQRHRKRDMQDLLVIMHQLVRTVSATLDDTETTQQIV